MSQIKMLVLLLLVSVSVSAQNFKFGKVSKEEVLEKEHPLDKNANAAVLYKYRRTYFSFNPNSGFQLVTEVQERIKVYNKEGFEWATKKISVYDDGGGKHENVSRIKGYTYNIENGKLVDEKLDKDQVIEEKTSRNRNTTKFTMPAVKEGSVIEYEYSIYSPFLTSIDDFILQYTIPINKLEAKFTAPEFFIFGKYMNMRAPYLVKVEQTHDNFHYLNLDYMQSVYTIDEENIPALRKESHVDYLQNYAAVLKWELQMTKFPNEPLENYSKTWEGVAKSIYDDVGLGKEINRTGFFEDEIDPLIAGISDPMQKIAKIFDYVKNKVKWNDYVSFLPDNGTKKTFKEGVGNVADINLLLTAILRYANVEAHPVLLSTPDNGIPLFPTRNGFNYVIAGVQLPDNSYLLLDASDRTAAMGELPARARNWQGRLIKEDGVSSWVDLNPKFLSEINNRINIQFKDGKIDGQHIKKLTGLHAKNYRNSHGKDTPEDYKEELQKRLSNTVINELNVENLQVVGADIDEKFTFESNNMEVIGDKIYFKPLLFDALTENPFKADERMYPIFFNFPSDRKNLVNIMVPEGYEVVSVPESIIFKLKDNAGEFRFIVSSSGNFIRIDSEVVLNRRIFPNTEFEYLKKFYNSVVEKQNESIVLGKVSKDGPEESTESGR